MYHNQQYTNDVSIPNNMKTLNVQVADKALYRCKACKVVHCVEICSDYSFNYAFEGEQQLHEVDVKIYVEYLKQIVP